MTTLGHEHGFLEVLPHDPAERRPDREVVVLLHGLGGNKSDWAFPAWRGFHWNHRATPQNRTSNNHFTPPYANPLDWLDALTNFSLSDMSTSVRCWEGMLRAVGHTVVNFSQDGPQAEVEVPLDQFETTIVPFIRTQLLVGPLAGKKVTLLCHSRGGILARAYIANRTAEATQWIDRVVTLASPHQGTLAPLAKQRLANAAASLLVGPILSLAGVDDLLVWALDKVTGWLSETDGANQLLPGNSMFSDLVDPADVPGIQFLTFGGTSVRYTRLYYWLYTESSFFPNLSDFPDARFDWELYPVELPIISPMLDQLPDPVVDDEQDNGEGDGLVADARASLPGTQHVSMPFNHAEALWDESIFQQVASILGTPLTGGEVFECTRGYIGNTRTLQFHDPSRENTNCQLAEIRYPTAFKTADEALAQGYDGCFWCLSQFDRLV
jgi:pimeloyl-ACP methyl ester carboxylesterase